MALLTRSAVFRSYPDEPQDDAIVAVIAPVAFDRHPVAVYIASLSPGSRRTMRAALRTIATILTGVGDELGMSWHLVDYVHATVVRTKLAERFAPATANRMLAALRGTLKAAFKLGLISADHYTRAAMVEPVRGHRLAKGRALSQGELRVVFDVCDPTTVGGARNAAVLGLLYGSGLRRAEVVALDVGDFDAQSGKLIVKGKGDKERAAFVTNGSLDALDTWLAVRGEEPGPLFMPVNRGGRIHRRRMSDQAVAELVRRLAQLTKMARFSPHDLRRSFIGDLLDRGADLATVQGLAGHASPMTTSRYDRRGDRAKKHAAELLRVPFASAS